MKESWSDDKHDYMVQAYFLDSLSSLPAQVLWWWTCSVAVLTAQYRSHQARAAKYLKYNEGPEKLNFYFHCNLNSHIWLAVTMLDSETIENQNEMKNQEKRKTVGQGDFLYNFNCCH